MDQFYWGMIIAGLLAILGIGTIAYVLVCQIKKMKEEYLETGFYSQGYINLISSIYGLPVMILLIILSQLYLQSGRLVTGLFIMLIIAFPSLVIRLLLHQILAGKIKPLTPTEKINKVKIMMLLVLLIFTSLFFFIGK